MQKIIVLLIFFFTLFSCFVYGQSNDEEEPNILLPYEKSIGISAYSNGFGIIYNRGKNITGYIKRKFEIEFASIKHPKEKKIFNPIHSDFNAYILGKQNSFFVLRGGLGRQKILFSREVRKNIEIRLVQFIGASIGLLKPVYLQVEDSASPYEVYYTIEKYNPEEHKINNILGQASFFKGMEEIKLWPGIYTKLGLNFEYGSEKKVPKILETGVILDYYPKAVPIYASYEGFPKNKNIFLEFYINLAFGKRW